MSFDSENSQLRSSTNEHITQHTPQHGRAQGPPRKTKKEKEKTIWYQSLWLIHV